MLLASLLAQDQELSASWGNQQNVHPVGLLMILVAGACMLFVKRRHATLPILFIAMFVTTAQRMVIGGLDFPFLRILILLGWLRLMMMNETRGFRMIGLDYVVIMWAMAFFAANVAREGQFVYCCGWTVDNVGAYFLFRNLLRTRAEIFQFSKSAALLAIPVAGAFLMEKMTRYNVFSVFGGVRAETWIREGKLRCMGAFQHPILAGCFFSGMFPDPVHRLAGDRGEPAFEVHQWPWHGGGGDRGRLLGVEYSAAVADGRNRSDVSGQDPSHGASHPLGRDRHAVHAALLHHEEASVASDHAHRLDWRVDRGSPLPPHRCRRAPFG